MCLGRAADRRKIFTGDKCSRETFRLLDVCAQTSITQTVYGTAADQTTTTKTEKKQGIREEKQILAANTRATRTNRTTTGEVAKRKKNNSKKASDMDTNTMAVQASDLLMTGGKQHQRRFTHH